MDCAKSRKTCRTHTNQTQQHCLQAPFLPTRGSIDSSSLFDEQKKPPLRSRIKYPLEFSNAGHSSSRQQACDRRRHSANASPSIELSGTLQSYYVARNPPFLPASLLQESTTIATSSRTLSMLPGLSISTEGYLRHLNEQHLDEVLTSPITYDTHSLHQ